METKICHWYTCKDPATHGVHCYPHYRQWGLTASYETGEEKQKAEKPKPAAIPKQSDKAKLADKEYGRWVKIYLARPENQECAIKLPGCQGKAVTINHKKRRGKDAKMNEKYVEPSCSYCNIEIENKDKEARDNGHLLTKYKM